MDGRTGLQLTNIVFARRRHGGSFIAGLLLLGALSALAGAARAADLPSPTQAPVFEPPPPAEFSWTRFYLGIHAGGGIDHFAFPFGILTPGGFFKVPAASPRRAPSAAFRPDLIASFRIDNSASGIGGQTTVNGTLVSGVPATATFGSKFEDFGTARIRLGYAWGRLMPYLTSGFTYGTIETFYSVATPGFFNAGSSTATRSGVFPHVGAAGGGVEYAIAPNFTVKVEYLYDFINARPVIFSPAASTIQFNTRRPRWVELEIRLVVALSRACRRKILKAPAKSRANQLKQRGWSARRSAHKRILAHSPSPRRFSAAQNALRIFAGAFRKARRNLPRPSRRYNSTCRR
jgi:outer membrane immunogenic protein